MVRPPGAYPSKQMRAVVSRVRRWLFEALMLVLIVVVVSLWQTRDVPFGPAPNFEAQLADGRSMSLERWRSEHPGQPLVVHFWAEWCSVCKFVKGSVDALAAEWPVLTVALRSGDADNVRRYLAEAGLDWPAVVDDRGAIAQEYGLYGTPAFVIIDAAGEIRFAEIGYTSELGLRLRLWWLSVRQ